MKIVRAQSVSERDVLLKELSAAERAFDNHHPGDRVGREIILKRVRHIEAQIAALDHGQRARDDD
jgi:hypothetical protein